MCKCPWCEKNSLSFWQKQTLGPILPRKCPNCSNYVLASWPSVLTAISLALVPVMAGLVYGYGSHQGDLPGTFIVCAGFALGAGLSIAWYQTRLRLVRGNGGLAGRKD